MISEKKYALNRLSELLEIRGVALNDDRWIIDKWVIDKWVIDKWVIDKWVINKWVYLKQIYFLY
jgi:hypothetical protein